MDKHWVEGGESTIFFVLFNTFIKKNLVLDLVIIKDERTFKKLGSQNFIKKLGLDQISLNQT